LHTGFRKAEVFHLALLNQFLHRARHVFDGHVQVNAMLVEQINDIHLQPLERTFDGLLDIFWPAVQARHTRSFIAAAQVESELGGDHQLLAKRRERFADEFFVGIWAVNFRRIEERDAAFDGA
jgi:hypothetical protein